MADPIKKIPSCFVLMSSDSELVNLWDAVIRPAIERAGLSPVRINDLLAGADIMQLVRSQIVRADVVLVVMTRAQSHVMYELGLAHAAKKKVLLMQEKGEPQPQGFSHLQFMKYDPRDFPESRESLIRALQSVQFQESSDLFPELKIQDPKIMEEYDYLKQTRKTLEVRVVPEFCSIFLNNRYLGRSPQTLSVNPDADRNVLSIAAALHFEHYQELSVADLQEGVLEITLSIRNKKRYLDRVHSWFMWRRNDSNSPVLANAIAGYLFDHGKLEQGKEESLLCTQMAPEWFHGYYSLGVIEYNLGNYDNARNCFQMVMTLNRDAYFGVLGLANIESLEGNFDTALNYLKDIIASPYYRESLRQIYSKNTLNPLKMSSSFDNLRQSFKYKQQFAELVKQFDELIKSNPPTLIPQSVPEIKEERELYRLPLTLKRIEIRDFQCIKSTGVDDLPGDAPWIIITGDNGEGKTSLLQAVAIGLYGTQDADRLLKENRFAHIGIETREGTHTVVRDFSRQDGHWIMTDPKGQKREPVVNLVAYGPSRLEMAAESTMDSQMARQSPVYNLLQQKGNLGNIEYWLKMRILEASWNEQDTLNRLRIKRVQEVLVELMPNVTRMELVKDQFQYTENGYQVTFNNLSSGQKNLLAMVGDLLIRLYTTHPETVDPADLQGIVLIDELDVHLHPSRQRELPSQLSRIFPNVQFVATTHSPIPILGVPKGSVFLRVVREPLKGTRIEQPDIEIGNLLPNAVLTSALFGMDSLLAKQNRHFADVHTEDDHEEIQRKKQVDEALQRFAQAGSLLPKGFLGSKE